MKYWTAVLFPVALAAGCGGGSPVAPPPADPVAESAPVEAPSDTIEMTYMEMHLWPTSEAPVAPADVADRVVVVIDVLRAATTAACGGNASPCARFASPRR